LLPTPTNLSPIFLPGQDLLQFIRVQQWVRIHLGIKLPLLQGTCVLAAPADLEQQQQALRTEPHAVCACADSSSIDSGAERKAAAIP
jgi:hypothetical protein